MVTSSGINLGNQVLGDPFFVHNVVTFSKGNQTIGITGSKSIMITEFGLGDTVWTGFIGIVILAVALIAAVVRESYYGTELEGSKDKKLLAVNQELEVLEEENLKEEKGQKDETTKEWEREENKI